MKLGPERLCAMAGSGRYPEFAWLDGGGEATSWVGLRSDVVVEVDRLDVLDEVDAAWRRDPDALWVGWVTYDLGAAFVRGEAPPRAPLAGLVMRRYAQAARVEVDGTVHWMGDAAALEDDAPISPRWGTGPLRAAFEPSDYRERVARALEFISAGESYQVNLSQLFTADWDDAALSETLDARAARAYAWMREHTPASMGALLRTPAGWVLSNSPETLVDVHLDADGASARSWPIKGTRARGSTPEEDARLARELQASPKDAAEHVMIVDLVRNDLGRIAVPGSVRAPDRPELVSLPTVHHLVSEVSARLARDWTLRELFVALFPGGSVTGAPKRRTVEIIDELEEGPREIYCGAIVLLAPGGVKVSIPIRTAIVDARGLRLRSGGGIVADSDPEAERLETVDKARAFRPPA